MNQMTEQTTQRPANNNVFTDNLKKNLGREITVVMFTPTGEVKLTGKCESIDFAQKSVIIRNDKNTYTIPRYLYLERPRPQHEEKA